jgi:hypothetical protein
VYSSYEEDARPKAPPEEAAVSAACPDPRALPDLALGRLPPDEVERLAGHCERCARCTEALQALPTQDTLVEAVAAQATRAGRPRDEAAEALIERLKQVPAPAPVDLNGLLGPAQAPDELGRLGPYRVLGVLGSGGMGVVFRAEDPQLQRPVALKAMLPELAGRGPARQRFLREARAAAALAHDHVVPVYQVGEDRGVPFLAMQLLEGRTLEGRLRQEGRLPLPEALRVGREVAEALAAAHARGLIHRDVKPANLWLEGDRGRVKVLDFGLARPPDGDAHLTQSGAAVGTPSYMAPEQAAGEAVDGRADLFGLGVVLYRACTGHLPFQGRNPVATVLAAATQRPTPPCQLNPTVPPGLSALILRLLSKAPDGRPPSARAVAEALAALERGPVARARRRRRWAIAAAVMAAAAVLASLVWTARPKDDAPDTPGAGAEATQMPAPTAAAPPTADAGPAPPVPGAPTGPARLLQIIKAPVTVGRCQALCFTPHGRRLVTGGYCTVAHLVDLEAGTQTMLPSGAALGARITPDGQHVYCLNLQKTLGKVSLLSRKWVPGHSYGELYYPLQTTPYRVHCGAFTRDCTLALLGCGEYPPGPPGRISPTDLLLAIGPDARLQPPERGRAGTAAKDCVIRLLDLATVKVVAELEGHTSPVVHIAVSDDGALALSCSFEGEALLWDLRKRCRLRRLGDADVFFLCGDFTPDGRQVLTASADHHLRLWDVATGAQRRLYTGHTALVRSLAISPDGAWALSSGGEAVTKGRGQFVGSKDCAVIAWDLRRGGELFRFSDPTHLMDKVGISPDGRLAVTVRRADRDCVYVWGLDAAVPPLRTKE